MNSNGSPSVLSDTTSNAASDQSSISTSRYSSVTVLVLSWQVEDPHLPVHVEIPELVKIFKNMYHYDVEEWKIPTLNSHRAVNRKIMDFVEPTSNDREHLKIVYYARHGNLTKTKSLEWTSRRVDPRLDSHSRLQSVQWSSIQVLLEQAENDVLILLDCCAAGTANAGVGNGVNFSPPAPIVERRMISSFSTGDLYRNIFLHAQYHSKQRRERPAPVHLPLTKQVDFPRSVQLCALRRQKDEDSKSEKSSHFAEEPSPSLPTPDHLQPGCEAHPISRDRPARPCFELLAKDLVPKILFAVRLKESFLPDELSINRLTEWVRTIPLLEVDEIKIEAGFNSFSSVIIVSIPIAMQAYIPSHPAIFCLGPVKSTNMLLSQSELLPTPVVTCPKSMRFTDDSTFHTKDGESPGLEPREVQKRSTEAESCSTANLQLSQDPPRLERMTQSGIPDTTVKKPVQSSVADQDVVPEHGDPEKLAGTTLRPKDYASKSGSSDRRHLVKTGMLISTRHNPRSGKGRISPRDTPEDQRYLRQHDLQNVKRPERGQASTADPVKLGTPKIGRADCHEMFELLAPAAWDLEKQHRKAVSSSVEGRRPFWPRHLSDLAMTSYEKAFKSFHTWILSPSMRAPVSLPSISPEPRTAWSHVSLGPMSSTRKQFLYAVCGVSIENSDIVSKSANWYLGLLEVRARESWVHLLRPVLNGVDPSSPTPGESGIEAVIRLLTHVIASLRREDLTLSDIVDVLINEAIVKTVNEPLIRVTDEERHRADVAQLVFVMLGWLTLLYTPDTSPKPNQLEIRSPAAAFAPEGQVTFMAYAPARTAQRRRDRYKTFRVLAQDLSLVDQPLPSLLQRFGTIIPDRKEPVVESIQPSSKWNTMIEAHHVSFYTFNRLSGIQIEWVDCLSLHLEFDPHTKTLAIFRFPSFCLLMACHRDPGPCSQIFRGAQSYWSEPDGSDARDYYKEVLLSYRLIFGMHNGSQQLFRQDRKSRTWAETKSSDPMLDILCGQSWETTEARAIWDEIDADEPSNCFNSTTDFRFLSHRLLTLQRCVGTHEPEVTWALRYDKRDTLRWYTFWVMLSISGAALFLGFLQVTLQLFQLYYTIGSPYNLK